MTGTCRYCHQVKYPIPELGHTLSLPSWKGEWAHHGCQIDAAGIVRSIVARFMSKLREDGIKRRSKQK